MTNALEMRKTNLVLPTTYYELDREEMSYVDGGIFIGFSASRENCIALFNSISNSVACRAITGTTLLSTLMTATKACFPAVYGNVLGILSAAWGKFCSLFTSGGPAGWIIGGIIAVAGLAAISYVAGMIVCGAMGNGFKIGLEIGWFKVNTVCTFI